MASRAKVKTLVVVGSVLSVLFVIYVFKVPNSSRRTTPLDKNSDKQWEQLGRSNRAGGPGSPHLNKDGVIVVSPVGRDRNNEDVRDGEKKMDKKVTEKDIDDKEKNGQIINQETAESKPKVDGGASSSNEIHIVRSNSQARRDGRRHTVMRDGIPQGVLTNEEVWALKDMVLNGGTMNPKDLPPMSNSKKRARSNVRSGDKEQLNRTTHQSNKVDLSHLPSDKKTLSYASHVPMNHKKQPIDSSNLSSDEKEPNDASPLSHPDKQDKDIQVVRGDSGVSPSNIINRAAPDNSSAVTDMLVEKEDGFYDNHSPNYPATTVMEINEATPLPAMPTFYPSKDLFVRAVYFDDRPRDGHQNTSVFLVVCLKDITDNNLIIGCQVGSKEASEFSVKLIGETPLWRAFYPQINHEEVLVHCYDLPVRNGSDAYIKYQVKKTSDVIVAASERPLFIPPPRVKPTSPEGIKYDMTIVTCAKIFKTPPWLEEWLTYQRTLGVDHVHLDAEDSFVKSGGLRKPFVERLMKEGFLTVDVWNEYLGMWEIWYHNQGLVYEDCPYRFRGVYDYIVMLDTDDFFTPRDPRELKLHYYINKYCRRNHIGSCKFRWVEYFPDAYGFNNESTADGNITRALRSYSHYNQGNPKSLHQTTALIDTATHYAYIMMPKYKIVQVPVNVAYVAHVRKWKKPPTVGLVEGLPNVGLDHCISRIFVALLATLGLIVLSLLG